MNQIQNPQSIKVAQVIAENYWKAHPERYFNDCLKILDKETGERISFNLNTHQLKVQAAINEQRELGVPVRIIILKPRQTGISTGSLANIFHTNRFNRNTGMVVSKDGDSAEHLHTITQRFYNYLPKSEKKVLKTVASNRKELKFEEPHGGRILIDTAGKTAAGHSFTIRQLLLSEVSRWPEGCEDTRIGLLNAVPRQPGTIVIIESVANGKQGYFWKEWYRKNSDYVKVFLAWFEHSEYRKELPLDPAAYLTTLTETERKLITRHSLSPEQIEWRRWAIRNNCDEDVDKFKEQYPATANEAFLASGNTFFNSEALEAANTQTGYRCDLRVFTHPRTRVRKIQVVDNPRGWLTVFKKPEVNRQYVWGADVAEGIEIDGAPAGDKRDYSPADVLDRHTGEQVAHFHAQITPDEFGRQLVLLGEYYNWAYGAPEMNGGYGWHVVETMLREKYPAYLLYREHGSDKYGWTTKPNNKKSLLSSLDMSHRNKEIILRSESTVLEMQSFITKPDGRLEGGSGQKDDRVMSLAIANYMMKVAPAMDLLTSHLLPDNKQSFQPVRYKAGRSIYERRMAHRQ